MTGADAPSMELDEVLGDREPEPAVAAGRQLLLLGEAVEDVWQAVEADPLPGVDHLDPGTGAGRLEANLDSAAGGCELDRVREKMLTTGRGWPRSRRGANPSSPSSSAHWS